MIVPVRPHRRPAAAPSPRAAPVGEPFVIHNVGWDFYQRFLDEVPEQPLRLTYDGRDLQLMNLSLLHERLKKRIARLIETVCYERRIDYCSGGSATFQDANLQRGLEPDECYWFDHESEVRGLTEIDFSRHAPPDLVVEVEVSRSVLDRIGIYAQLRVPEVWRVTSDSITVLRFQPKSCKYVRAAKSRCFPFLNISELANFLTFDTDRGELATMRDFTAWLNK